MRWSRGIKSLGLALLLLVVGVSCTSSDAPNTDALGPSEQQAPSFGLIGDLTGGLTTTLVGTLGSATDLLLCSRQPYAITTQTIGPEGGVLNVGTHSLAIPQSALSAKVTITAEQIRGTTNSVRFSPEGLHFLKPATLTMTYENCALVLLQKKIVFTNEDLKVLEVLSSLDLFKSKTVKAPIDHFSRYAVAY
jgi:hypothetical protein